MNLLPGAEPFYFPGGPVGCLLIHGFTATPQVMRPLGERLTRAGHTSYGIRLPGHGTAPADLNRVSWRDWAIAVEEGVRVLRGNCDQIFLIGHSTGGSLALHFAGQEQVTGVAGISTMRHLPEDGRFALLRKLPYPIRLQVFRLYARRRKFLEKGPPAWYDWDAHREYIAYKVNPINAIIELRLLLGELERTLPGVACPLLLLHSINDETIPYGHAEEFLAGVASTDKTLIRLEHCGHVAPLDAEREIVFAEVVEFVERLARA